MTVALMRKKKLTKEEVDMSRPENNPVALYTLGMLERWRAPSVKDGGDMSLPMRTLIMAGHPRPIANGILPTFAFEYTFDVQDSAYTALEVLRDEQVRGQRRRNGSYI